MEGESFEARRQARGGWPVRRFPLGDEPAEDVSTWTTPEERLVIAWRLSVECWQIAGGVLPAYDRRDMPTHLLGRDEPDPR